MKDYFGDRYSCALMVKYLGILIGPQILSDSKHSNVVPNKGGKVMMVSYRQNAILVLARGYMCAMYTLIRAHSGKQRSYLVDNVKIPKWSLKVG